MNPETGPFACIFPDRTIQLRALAVPHLSPEQNAGRIVNISSGGGRGPARFANMGAPPYGAPPYAAAKWA